MKLLGIRKRWWVVVAVLILTTAGGIALYVRINSVDYKGATEGARKKINAWVEEQTNDRIKDLVPAGEDPVEGTGSLDVVFSPFTSGMSGTPLAGTTTLISGTWKDW